MIEILKTMFSYSFIIRAFIVGILLSVCCGLLGITLVLKKFSMIGDGLSHVGFGAMTVALALNVTPMYIAVPVMVAAAFLLLKLRNNSTVNGDAAIAMISASSIAVGIVAASCSGGLNTDVYSYMFGSILTVSGTDLIAAAVLFAVTVTIYCIFYNRIFALTFDPEFSAATKAGIAGVDMLLALLTAAVVVIGMRFMGTMLISGLIVFPAITGMQCFRSFKGVVLGSVCVSVAAFIIGMTASYIFRYVPAGAGIVLANLILLALFFAVKKIKHKVSTTRQNHALN